MYLPSTLSTSFKGYVLPLDAVDVDGLVIPCTFLPAKFIVIQFFVYEPSALIVVESLQVALRTAAAGAGESLATFFNLSDMHTTQSQYTGANSNPPILSNASSLYAYVEGTAESAGVTIKMGFTILDLT